ncbi:hypothetical protein [Methylobacterium oryzisoli]|uniref:hypothetical protein n=1 Tax=Methylobacterium oryzisoli TaxID=3385502 RepID=UPI0038914847
MRTFVSTLVISAVATAASAREAMKWIPKVDRGTNNVVLYYGVPNSSNHAFFFDCHMGTGRLGFTTPAAEKRVGSGIPISLAAEQGSLRVSGNTEWSEMDDAFDVVATALRPEPMKQIFASSGDLRVTYRRRLTTYPLNANFRAAYAVFAQHCPSL